MLKIPERMIRFQTQDNYNSLSENENETWRVAHHSENESVLSSSEYIYTFMLQITFV